MMKAPLHRTFRMLRRDALAALRYTLRWLVQRRVGVGVAFVLALAGVFVASRFDDAAATVLGPQAVANAEVKDLAKMFSYYGDFLGFNLILFVALQIAGWGFRSRLLMRLAVASIIGCTLAGAAANVLRFATGRPRPSTQKEDGFYGPHFSSSMQAFPSAHTATALGGALPLLWAHPMVGAPLSLFAGGVAWSRIHLNRHHLSDVLASALIALGFSLPLSRWALRIPLTPRPR